MSQVHLTSAAVKGLPSCHVTPARSLKISDLPSSVVLQLSARSGTIDERLFCGTCWSNMTRLLKTPIIGPSTAIVDSSWIDMLAGLVISGMRNVPPCFCADAGETAARQPSAASPAAHRLHRDNIVSLPDVAARLEPLVSVLTGLLIEPDILHAPAIEQAVDD